jgi:DNA-binding response OmpR family regulator
LIVEDEALLAFLLEDILQEAGCTVLGPAYDVSAAFAAINRMKPDAVTLDLNLSGESGIPIADLLLQRGIPYVIASANSPSNLPPRHAHVGYLIKPFCGEALVNALLKALFPPDETPALQPQLYAVPFEAPPTACLSPAPVTVRQRPR